VHAFRPAIVDDRFERNECTQPTCDTALTTYGRALRWLADQLIFQSTPGLAPSSSQSITLGVLGHFLLPSLALVGLVAARRQNEIRHLATVRAQEERHRVLRPTRVMIMTVLREERRAVLTAAERATKQPARRNFTGNQVVYELGQIEGAQVSLVQAVESGTTTPGGAAMVAASAIKQLEPDYAIITGICYGLRPEIQRFGDVLVSRRVRDLDLGGLYDDGTGIIVQDLSENLQASHLLLSFCQSAEDNWDQANVHFGEMLAWNKNVDSELVVRRLRKEYRKAVSGEMEGAGFHSAARREGVHWVLVKAISDYGYNTNKNYHELSATNAADFVVHMIQTGAFRTRPDDLYG
jgi:nucleoside phosphorylase